MRGTPSLILIGRHGTIRKHKFGQEDDMTIGAEIMALVREDTPALVYEQRTGSPILDGEPCADESCPAPKA